MTFLRTACASPKVRLANSAENREEIISYLKVLADQEVDLALFPELSLTGASLGDLYRSETLLAQAKESLFKLRDATEELPLLYFVGLPIKVEEKIYSAMAGIYKGRIEVLIARSTFPSAGTYDDKRSFHSLKNPIILGDELILLPSTSTFSWAGTKISLFYDSDLEKLYKLDLAREEGLDLLLIPAATPWKLGQAQKRERDLKTLSGKGFGILYASAGLGESSGDQLYSGEKYILERGECLEKSLLIGENPASFHKRRDQKDSSESSFDLILTDLDLEMIRKDQAKGLSIKGEEETEEEILLKKHQKEHSSAAFCLELAEGTPEPEHEEILRKVDPLPFVPDSEKELQEILTLQALGLCGRMEATRSKDLWIGISGGLDSTLALLVCTRAMDILGLDRKNIHAVTMPFYGSSDQTHDNAWKLGEKLSVDFREIPLYKAMEVHFKDIGLKEGDHSVAYENAQARERTQILFDLSNLYGGILVGTGDLSENALGWSTYNGDHMSSYGVNISIPKTLVRALVLSEAGRLPELREILLDILDTPVSPELLPLEKGEIAQETEKIIGPYEFHDFFLYYFINYGFGPEKLMKYARAAFKDRDPELILKTMEIFFQRFTKSQFKRSCSVEGPSIGILSLSPRGGWMMPSDIADNFFQEEIEKLKEKLEEK